MQNKPLELKEFHNVKVSYNLIFSPVDAISRLELIQGFYIDSILELELIQVFDITSIDSISEL